MINFVIKRIKVHTNAKSQGYKFPGEYTDVITEYPVINHYNVRDHSKQHGHLSYLWTA